MVNFSDEEIQNVQTICQVGDARAVELLEASSGSVERAVGIHFATVGGKTQEEERANSVQSTMSKDVASKRSSKTGSPSQQQGEKIPPRKAQSQAAKTDKKRQGTLDAFLGTSPPPTSKSKQRKLDSFFSITKKEEVDNEHTAKVQPDSPPSASRSRTEEEKPAIRDFEDTANEQKSQSDDSSKMELAEVMNTTDPRLCYSHLSRTFAEMTSTTKRTIKLNALKDMFIQVIDAIGGIHLGSRREDARILTCTIDLVLGKLSLTRQGSNNAAPLQVSGAAVSKAVQTITGASRTQLREAYRQMGDFGDVAADKFVSKPVQSFFVKKKEAPPLTIVRVHEMLYSIATVSGKGSQASRQNLLVKLLRAAKQKDELRFLVRTLLGNMRLGATIKSVLAGLAMAIDEVQNRGTMANRGVHAKPQESIDILQKTFNICPRLDQIAYALLHGGVLNARKDCSLSIGFPVQPMLANAAHSLEEVQKFLANEDGQPFEAVLEWKYDGVRCQAHFDGSKVCLFSRNLLDNSEQYPDAIAFFLGAKKANVESFIVDSEIVGVEPSDEAAGGFRLLPFQDLATRRGIKQEDDQIQVRIYSFDLLYLNGVSLLDQPLSERQAALREHFQETAGFGFATSVPLPHYDEAVMQSSLEKAFKGGAEGLMIKLTGQLETEMSNACIRKSFGYEAGDRSQLWLKLKRDYVAGYADTIDVVPIGAWFGSGRKAEKGFLSPILLAVYDDEEGAFRSISRCMSFTDSMYHAMREFYFRGTPYPPGVGIEDSASIEGATSEMPDVSEREKSPQDIEFSELENATASEQTEEADRVNCFPGRPSSSYIITNESPSVWFKPMEVFEISFADLSLSRAHTAAGGLVHDPEGRGVALRFPRFKRRRPDKTIEQATTTEQIAQLFAQQAKLYSK